MRRFTTLSLVIAAGLAATSANAVVVWTGGGADANAVFADDNYAFGGSTLTAIDQSVAVLDDVTITGATINATDYAGFGEYRIGDGFALTLDNASLTSNASGGLGGVLGGASSTFNLNNGSSMNMQFITFDAIANVDGTSSIKFRGGGAGAVNSAASVVLVNLEVGAQIIFNTTAILDSNAAEIFVNGVSYADDSSILTVVDGVGTAVPEPGSLALLGLGGLMIARRRRA